ncbi:MAG: CoA transferase subunit A [Candidatus Tectomicrobia bacterium]|nr:CoA transferase subunit A [Candidatus Tectomicrobia bacterium]
MSVSYPELRRRIESRDRGLREKVMTLSEAASLVRDGDHVGIGGNTFSRTPFAMVWELVRQRKKNLTVSRNITSTEGDLLLAGGCTRHYITSWFSQGIIWGVSRVMRHFVESGEARFEEWSHMSIGLMYRAGAMGLPFMPTRVMLGSDVARNVETMKEMTCPFTGEKLALIPALNPDVALIHVHRADPYGNAQFDGLPFMDADLAMAADKVILTTEQVIHNDQIRRAPDRTKIPYFCVEAVVEVPYGSVPHECWGLYEPFYRHMDFYAKLTREKGLEGAHEYLKKCVYEPEGWNDFLNRVGFSELIEAMVAGRRMYSD